MQCSSHQTFTFIAAPVVVSPWTVLSICCSTFFCSNALIAFARSLCKCLLAVLIIASEANRSKLRVFLVPKPYGVIPQCRKKQQPKRKTKTKHTNQTKTSNKTTPTNNKQPKTLRGRQQWYVDIIARRSENWYDKAAYVPSVAVPGGSACQRGLWRFSVGKLSDPPPKLVLRTSGRGLSKTMAITILLNQCWAAILYLLQDCHCFVFADSAFPFYSPLHQGCILRRNTILSWFFCSRRMGFRAGGGLRFLRLCVGDLAQ